ncbi:GHKL domain-containing protein [Listeria weihenstephanensis]|uniref:GHKL domain-containing protein n=1 Tax=Listeria weihenstephanensis TaxID=1006155 RepID=A0A841Z6Y0_9LIST|nr:GHKL domain-containing protein [Listeria weihenstephanensis]MBC1501000.1 GHKL domain-containing protein [Listeria weihenstephanensis]
MEKILLQIVLGLVQVVALVIGVQIICRISFSWKLRMCLVLFLSFTAIPIFFYMLPYGLQYLSVMYMMVVVLIVLFVQTKKVMLPLITIFITFIGLVVSDGLSVSLTDALGELIGQKFVSYGWVTIIFYAICIALILKIIDIIFTRNYKEMVFQSKYLLLILVVSATTLLLFYLYIWQGSKLNFSDSVLRMNAIVFIVYAVVMTIVLAIIIKNAVKSAKVEAQALQMKQLREYVGALEALQKDMRVFRHDYVNMLSGINGFITDEDMDGLSVYFRTKVIPMNSDMEVNISKLATLHNLEVVELKGLFATKMIRAQELGVDAQVEIFKMIKNVNMDSIDLCRAVGILLDNAIEAVVDTDDPTIRVAIIQKKEAIVLIFANSLPDDAPAVHQFFEEGFSTKGENRGIGLSTLKKTLKKYPNVSLETKITQQGFVQELEIG